MQINLFIFFGVIFTVFETSHCGTSTDSSGVILPSTCEVCKFLVTELQGRLHETGKYKKVIETGHGLDTNKKKIQYITSELRLIEAIQDPHICDKILEYNLHKERSGSNRFAKGRSETMNTLHGLKNKGVKVELGIPDEMWDSPSAEVTDMQKKCYTMVENYEEDIEEWYFHHQDQDLKEFLCRNIVLKKAKESPKCLTEVFKGDPGRKSDTKPIKAAKTEL